MENVANGTAPDALFLQTVTGGSPRGESNGNAYLYILIVLSFYGIFLLAIALGYVRSKRRDKRRSNVFTRLLHEEAHREWGAWSQKKHSLTVPAFSFPPLSVHVPLPFCAAGLAGGLHEGGYSRVLAPLACALCSVEQSSVSSLCSATEARFAIEEESDSGTGEGLEEPLKGSSSTSDNSEGSAENLKVAA